MVRRIDDWPAASARSGASRRSRLSLPPGPRGPPRGRRGAGPLPRPGAAESRSL